jgi:predicted nuclease of predicted toxin-antitoxin system
VRVKLDENLPFDATGLLRQLGHDVETLVSEGLAGRTDVDIVAAASAESRFLMTLDRGMGDNRAHPPGTTPGSPCSVWVTSPPTER